MHACVCVLPPLSNSAWYNTKVLMSSLTAFSFSILSSINLHGVDIVFVRKKESQGVTRIVDTSKDYLSYFKEVPYLSCFMLMNYGSKRTE